MTENVSFGYWLKRRRKALDLTQENLAHLAGYSVSAIRKVEADELQPSKQMAEALADHLRVPPERRGQFVRFARGQANDEQGEPEFVGPEATPTAPIAPRPRSNLPTPLTSFIGRERELAKVGVLLKTTRLVTLTGTGGCGKTRLALQVAADVMDDYPEGVWLVELASLTDPSLVAQTTLSTLGIRAGLGHPSLDTLIDYLRPRRVLLVVDNCEHLIGACARLIEAVLLACPGVHILAASRELLRVSGEVIWSVPSLALPDPKQPPSVDRLREVEAVRLFVERAAAVHPGFALTAQNAGAITQICCRLDGIPLAIELAAARVRVLGVEQIAARLDDRFRLLTGGGRTALRRHQTLQALIDWSYDLLSEAEQALLRRLAVFAGGWTLEAAEAVCTEDVLDLLTQVVDKSLVSAEERDGQVRYRMLETVRQYLRAKLHETGEEEEIRAKHLNWYLRVMEEKPSRKHFHLGTRLDRLEVEQDNLRAALEWSLTHDLEKGLLLAASIWGVWLVRGYGAEGRYWAEALLARAPASSLPAARVGYQLALLAMDQGDFTAARIWGEQALARCRELGDPVATSWALLVLGHVENYFGDRRRAAELYAESLRWFEQGDEKVGASLVLCGQGTIACNDGDVALARTRFEEALALARQLDDGNGAGWALLNLGILANADGDEVRARSLLDDGLASFRTIGDKSGTAVTMGYLGYLAGTNGDIAQARALIRESLILLREIGHRPRLVWNLWYQGDLHVRQGAPAAGVRLIAAATAARPNWQACFINPYVTTTFASTAELAQSQLGRDRFAAAWAEGQAMTLEQAITYALSDDPPES
jgi:non-specific serine/threonine protein kinase